ncbi:hypothetical protein LPJ61_004107 [Coemansia biformis]|uniref:PEBP-like protein n=1 Tax=Coemansia biformis TaxID=1286918 RepID=A0A9W8CVN9_9FUNG|nr:hypothetical protein LPJ61_004107 [Coemansia biformis]
MDRRRVELRVGPDPENPLAPYLLGEANGKPDTPTSKQELSIVRDELQDAYLIPDVLPDTFAPEFPVAIRFNGERVLLGELLSVQQTQSEPTIEFDAAPGQYFAIAIVDPDAPSVSRHGYRSYRHYLLGNLEPRSFDILTPFEPPSPSAGPAHRYAVVVFRQHGHIEFNRDDVPDSRVRFDAVKWGRELNMKLVASTFFMVKDSRTTKVRH